MTYYSQVDAFVYIKIINVFVGFEMCEIWMYFKINTSRIGNSPNTELEQLCPISEST
jgi:hypothetical protein